MFLRPDPRHESHCGTHSLHSPVRRVQSRPGSYPRVGIVNAIFFGAGVLVWVGVGEGPSVDVLVGLGSLVLVGVAVGGGGTKLQVESAIS